MQLKQKESFYSRHKQQICFLNIGIFSFIPTFVLQFIIQSKIHLLLDILPKFKKALSSN